MPVTKIHSQIASVADVTSESLITLQAYISERHFARHVKTDLMSWIRTPRNIDKEYLDDLQCVNLFAGDF